MSWKREMAENFTRTYDAINSALFKELQFYPGFFK